VSAVSLRPPVSKGTARSAAAVKPGIYHVCLNQPYIQLTQAMASTTMKLHAPQATGTAASATSVEHEDSSRSHFCTGVLPVILLAVLQHKLSISSVMLV